MDYRHSTLLLFCGCALVLDYVDGFNLSPQPNYKFTEPNFQTLHPKKVKTRSSYFGYSINLRSHSVMVGAPRAQSSLEIQRNIDEPGAIYKCLFNSSNCVPFVIVNSETKDNQWLGASMDGNLSERGLFVVCAPRMKAWAPRYDDFFMHGLCYFTTNTLTTTQTNAQKIAPLRRSVYQVDGYHGNYFYMYGEQGISVHITENGEEILIGAPGVSEWKGTIIRYKEKPRRNKSKLGNDYDVVVPNPAYWGQADGDYFGYALASGYFQGPRRRKILYVASAPQANVQEGQVYIFDIVGEKSAKPTIQIYHTFTSYQMGEYFGYALAAGDFNGDGFYDLAICAPFYGKKRSFDNGAVYIYQNLGESMPGRWSSNFVLQSVLLSDFKVEGGRFGSSISKLGDINLDGYNDIAIGAPYEDNGAVYIYLGGPNGIIAKPSQRLVAPYNANVAPFTPHMFGHSLSKGSDIDQNNYLDLAVGAPNAEAVYVYRSYPVVKIIANVYPLSKELRINDTSLKFRACWYILSKVLHETRIIITIKMDKKFERVKFNDGTNQLEANLTAAVSERCDEYDAVVKFSPAHVFKPIEIEMKHSVLYKVLNSSVFCTKCVAVNPSDSKEARTKVVFITGCGNNAKCVADLKLSSEILNPLPYTIGSSNNISLSYKIGNSGETAYLVQINITISESVGFTKTPSSCQLYNKRKLLCNINSGSPLNRGELGFFNISLDTTNLEGSELLVNATVSSTGDESNDRDNQVIDMIPLTEFSDVEMTGKSNKQFLDLQDGADYEIVAYTYEVRNNGPTSLKHIDVVVSIPISYENELLRLDVISIENMTLKNEYKNQQFGIEWIESNTSTYQRDVDPLFQSVSRYAINNTIGMNYDAVDYDSDRTQNNETDDEYTTVTPNDVVNNYQNVSNRNRDLENLMTNRTISFDCFESTTTSRCVQAKFSVNNFQAGIGGAPLLIKLQLRIDLIQVDKLFTKDIDSVVIRPSIQLLRNDDEDGNKMHVVHSYAFTSYTYVWKQGAVGVWVYILSFLAGLLTLILITFGLYKLGFFRRKKKEELKILVRQSQIARLPKPHQDDE